MRPSVLSSLLMSSYVVLGLLLCLLQNNHQGAHAFVPCSSSSHWKRNALYLAKSTSSLSSTRTSTTAPPRTGVTQWLLDIALQSPLWKHVLVPQARAKIVQTAQDNGIPWKSALAWLQQQDGLWNSPPTSSISTSDDDFENMIVPDYYRKSFHAYPKGNLSWDAALEVELASCAVGARNFPAHGPRGEEFFRNAFHTALLEAGATIQNTAAAGEQSDVTIVDLGCGTGMSTRRLAQHWPQSTHIIGIDQSPYYIHVGTRLLELAPLGMSMGGPWVSTIVPDSRIDYRVGDAAHTGLPDESAAVVNLQFVLHELPAHAAQQIVDEAYRVLTPGGQLWICEMDFESPAYAAQRANAMLFSLIRSTEPYLDDYADSTAALREYMVERFESVSITAATGRHYALVATKKATSNENGESSSSSAGKGTLQDMRFHPDGTYRVSDTHLQVWENKRES